MPTQTSIDDPLRLTLRDRLRLGLRDFQLARFVAKLVTLAKSRESVRRRPREAVRYLLRSREVSNWTYEVENEDELLQAVADALGRDLHTIRGYAAELRDDRPFLSSLERRLDGVPRRDAGVRLGYRVMHYCVVRAQRSKWVVELGTHDGLGAAVVLRALERNEAEGDIGRLVAFDESAEAGWLIPDELRGRLTTVVGDASELMDAALDERGVDFLIQDIGPVPAEREMFEIAARHASASLIVRGELDDSHRLEEFARRHHGRFLSVQEIPRLHFSRGTNIGLAVLEP